MWRTLTAWGQNLEQEDKNLNAYSEAILQRIRRLIRWTKGLL